MDRVIKVDAGGIRPRKCGARVVRDYSKISPKFWTGDTGRFLRGAGRDAQVVALYLLTCPHANMIGLYYLPFPVLCHETGLSQQGALKALQRVSEGGFAFWEAQKEAVFVPEMAAHQVGEPLDPKDNRVKGIVKEWSSMRKSPFYMDFYERYRESFHLPAPSPLQAPCKPLGSQEQEQEIEQEQEQETDTGAAARFAEFWEAYPARRGKKLGKSAARSAFRHLSDEDQTLAMTASRNYGASDTAKRGFARDAKRFFEGGFWRDWITPEPLFTTGGSNGIRASARDGYDPNRKGGDF